MDKKIKEFESQLVDLINSTEIPAGAAYYVLKDILIKVQNVFQNNVILDEQQQKEEKAEQPQEKEEEEKE